MTVRRRPGPARSLIVAAAGYGKTVAMEAELPAGARRFTGKEALDADLGGVPAVGVDDLDVLSAQQQVALVRRLAALPPDVGLVLASRTPLAPAALAGLRGRLSERGPIDLLLSHHEVARLLAVEHDLDDPHVAEQVHAVSAGWPALVHLAADAVVHGAPGDLLASLTATGSATSTWLEIHVLGAIGGPVGLVADLGPVIQPVLDRVATALGCRADPAAAAYLRRVGVLLPRRAGTGEQRDHVVPVVARILSARAAGTDPDVTRAAFRAAASAYEELGLWLPSARALDAAGDWAGVERLVDAHGEVMVRSGEAARVAALLGDRSGPRSEPVRAVHADSLRLSGEPEAALRTLRPLVAAADRTRWPTELASRVGAVHHTLGDYRAALDALDRGCADDDRVDVHRVEWLSLRVRVLSMLGRRAEAQALAAETLAAAEQVGSPRARAAAHVALARLTEGARKEAHHEQARRAAEEWGDAVTVALVLVNQAHLELAGARFTDAASSAREVVRIAELGSPPGRLVAALHNLAEALARLGEYDEAMWHLHRAVTHARRLGEGATAVGLLGLADVHRELGHHQQALSAYSEAVRLARRSQETQVLVPALAGLARLTAGTSPEAARATAEEAYEAAGPAVRPYACLARGWVAVAGGDRVAGAPAAAEAVEAARQVRALDLVAEALELTAECAENDEQAVAALGEAHAIWRSGGAVPAAARVEVLLGGLATADAAARSRARDGGRLLQRLGFAHVHGRPITSEPTVRAVAVRVLGGFAVTVAGSPVPLSAWRSRQARTLVKILAARRGRPVTRASLCDLLWPDDDPSRTGHRLSVLLTTVRGVLDPDKRWPPERYVASDMTGVWLDLSHVRVDADDLIRDADAASQLLAEDQQERAAEILADVDLRYAGDAFEEEPDAAWADGIREETRAAWVRSVRLLVSIRNRTGRAGDSPALLVRLLAADPYDEQAHRLLVRSLLRTGRRGEAERALARWTAAMQAIDAPPPEAALLDAVLTPR